MKCWRYNNPMGFGGCGEGGSLVKNITFGELNNSSLYLHRVYVKDLGYQDS